MKTLLTLIAFLIATTFIYASPELIFIGEAGKVEMPEMDRKRIIEKIEEITLSANFNSRDHAKMFREADKDYWRPLDQIRSGTHILLRYAKPHVFKTVGGEITALEIWLDLQKEASHRGGAVYPGPVTVVTEDGLVRLTKEGGYLVLGLGLDPTVYPHLPKIIRENMDRSRNSYEEFQKQNKG